MTFEYFCKKVIEYNEQIKNVKEVRLNSEYLQKLIEFKELVINSTNKEIEDFTKLQDELLKHSNLLHKEKNKSNYKKDKHKHKKFNDGYY